MNDQSKTGPSLSRRSEILRFFRWLFSWRGIRRLSIILAWCVTVIALWYGEENWRGRRAWNQYREATEAHGESLDFASYIPKPVPDDQNFAATPFLTSFILHRNDPILTNDLYARATANIDDFDGKKSKGGRRFLDLAAWQMAADALQRGPLKNDQTFSTQNKSLAARMAAAPSVLEGMAPDQATFAELRAASSREFSRYPLYYDLENPWGILLPHLARLKQLCQRLDLQACAELALNQSVSAFEDVKLSLALADSLKSEPFLISILVRASCLRIAVQSVWEGLAEHRWNDVQLQELQTRFLAYNFPADVQLSLRAERACGALTADLAKRNGFNSLDMYSDPGQKMVAFDSPECFLLGKFMPAGWYDLEKLNYGTLFDAQQAGVMDLRAKTVFLQKAEANSSDVAAQIYGHSRISAVNVLLSHHCLSALLLPSLHRIPDKMAMAQTAANQAALACALERYRLAHGAFPAQLDALAPAFISQLPNDVLTGQPYKYRRTDDGQFILYSVRWNEKEDRGVFGETLFDLGQGDWVWQYPAASP